MKLIQLPDDVVSMGYRKISNFEYAQVFSSKSKNFTGSEAEFMMAGHAYAYAQIGKYIRQASTN